MQRWLPLLLVVLYSQTLVAQWVDISPPGNNDLNWGLYFLNADTGFVGGEGVVKRTYDGGATWDLFDLETMGTWYPTSGIWPILIRSIHFVDENHGYMGCQDGWIFKTTDGGDSWTQLPRHPGVFDDVMDIHFFSPDTGIALPLAHFLRTNDGGVTWEETLLLTSLSFYPFDLSRIVTVGGGIHISTNAGIFFSEIEPKEGFIDIAFGTSKNALASRKVNQWSIPDGSIWSSEDGGLTWKFKVTTKNWRIWGISYREFYPTDSVLDSLEVYAVGRGIFDMAGGIFVSHDSGDTWEIDHLHPHFLFNVQFPTPDVGYAVGHGGSILKLELPRLSTAIEEPVEAVDALNGLQVYPSIANDFVTVDCKGIEKLAKIEIFSSYGDLVISKEIDNPGLKKLRFDLGKFSSGRYFVLARAEAGTSHIGQFLIP